MIHNLSVLIRVIRGQTSGCLRDCRGLVRHAIPVGLLLMLLLAAAVPAVAETDVFITRDGDQLMEGDRPYRFISMNVPNLLVIEDAFSLSDPNPWRWPDEFEITDALESVRQMGGQVVRTYVISVYCDGSDMGQTVHVLAPGEFNEEGFRALDKVLQVAGQKGIRVIIPLVDQWKWMGGIGQYAAFRGKPAEAFWTDPQVIADFKRTIDYVAGRKNHYTGVAYRDDPAIMAWETGNEVGAPAEWTRQIAAYIKQVDPNHLVVDGVSRSGISEESLADPNIDIVTTHHYPGWWKGFVGPIREARAVSKGKKPYFVGEFGFVGADMFGRTIDAVIDDGVAGALAWSLRFHSRDGGFYWHSEVLGGDKYKAYHWPGFDSGQAYDEREVLELMRAAAFKIQGRDAPPREKPAPPQLLPIGEVSRISWRGSAGAESYDVERAATADGPWTVIASGVSDAAVQYRPLLCDESAVPGEKYYYRVVAKNVAGSSEPSNVVGPVAVECRTLVDECENLDQVWRHAGDVKLATSKPRRVQEDAHRLELPTGASVAYRLEGPVHGCRVYAFASRPDAPLEVAVSRDGIDFEDVVTERQAFATGPGEYGYLVPILLRCDIERGDGQDGGPTYLRLAAGPGAGGNPTPKAASERDSTDGEPIAVSRIEIEYGCRP